MVVESIAYRRRRARALELTDEARAHGINAEAVEHDEHGWICSMANSGYVISDVYDIRWAILEAKQAVAA